jgi:hypothetical protein
LGETETGWTWLLTNSTETTDARIKNPIATSIPTWMEWTKACWTAWPMVEFAPSPAVLPAAALAPAFVTTTAA